MYAALSTLYHLTTKGSRLNRGCCSLRRHVLSPSHLMLLAALLHSSYATQQERTLSAFTVTDSMQIDA